jgi:hypothetical protein
VDVKIATQQELLDAHWRPLVGDWEKGVSILDHDPLFQIALSSTTPSFWNTQDDPILFVGSQDGAQWDTQTFSSQERKWYLRGDPLQEPVDQFSSLALSDRVRNRLALLAFQRGELGHLIGG